MSASILGCIRAWFDGACEPQNPGGHATWGAVVEVNNKVVFEKFGYVGSGRDMSNNVAEYGGCLAVLEEIKKYGGDATVFGDSDLVINQLRGRYRAKGGLYLPYFHKANTVLEAIGRGRVRFEWIPAEQNKRADDLSRQALAELGITPADHRRRRRSKFSVKRSKVAKVHTIKKATLQSRRESPRSTRGQSGQSTGILTNGRGNYDDQI